MEIKKENFYTAYFIDNERKTIEILLKHPDMKSGNVKVMPHVIEYDEKHPDCQSLLKICPLDDLHENTWNKKRVEREDFVAQVKSIAENDGLLKDFSTKGDVEMYKFILDFLTTDKQEHLDKLFSFKIFLFEQDVVKNYKIENVKSEIRKAKTPIEALKVYIKIWEESKKTTN